MMQKKIEIVFCEPIGVMHSIPKFLHDTAGTI